MFKSNTHGCLSALGPRGGLSGPQISLGCSCFSAAEPEAGGKSVYSLIQAESVLVVLRDTLIHYTALGNYLGLKYVIFFKIIIQLISLKLYLWVLWLIIKKLLFPCKCMEMGQAETIAISVRPATQNTCTHPRVTGDAGWGHREQRLGWIKDFPDRLPMMPCPVCLDVSYLLGR